MTSQYHELFNAFREARSAFEDAARLTRNVRERAWLLARAHDCEG